MNASILALPLLTLVGAAWAAPQPTPSASAPELVLDPSRTFLVQDDDEAVPAIQQDGDSFILNFPDPGDAAGKGMTLVEFVDACQQVTEINFTYTDETANFLQNAKIRLMGTKVVPKERFYSFFQILMIINDFVCIEKGEGALSIIEIQALQAARQIRSDSILVTPEELDNYANQPATLITTVINLPNTDVRQLSNSMRTMITDQNTQQMLPAGATNSMVLTGFGSDVVALARMLMIVDEASRIDEVLPVFEVIRLEFAAADEVSSLVEELLEAQQGAANRRAGQPAQGATGQLGGQTEAKIMVDPRTNSLLVMAMPDEMPRIKDLVARLDVEIVERERSYHIYNLENVKAEELSEVLNEFLDNASRVEQQQAPNNPQGGRGNASSGSEFVVVDDAETNSLLIAASRTRYEELLSLIRRLDRRQHQVLIETALIELTGDDLLDIGVELGFAKIPGVDSQSGFGVTNFGLSTFQDTDGDGLADSRIPSLGTGISAGILDGEDFSLPMLISLVETKQNSNVLNVPSVLVNNNGRARVEALERQPTTTVTQTGGVGGSQENFNDYQDAGITMEISPSISASNYLRLDLYLKVSTFQGSFSGSIPPPQLERTLETTVNVPDGDTMVIGGIVVDNRTDTRSQIPWVGNLPILGRLFGRDTNSRSRTALYFFVTPTILEDADFADLAELSYRKKLEAAENIGLDRMQRIDPKFGRTDDTGPVDLNGFDLPLYTSPTRGEVDGSQVGLDPIKVHGALMNGNAAPINANTTTFLDTDQDGLPDSTGVEPLMEGTLKVVDVPQETEAAATTNDDASGV
tara:strand:- start:455 stop:2881 length:2427 start_codon:yes stop_codon:yes gene_type:complete